VLGLSNGFSVVTAAGAGVAAAACAAGVVCSWAGLLSEQALRVMTAATADATRVFFIIKASVPEFWLWLKEIGPLNSLTVTISRIFFSISAVNSRKKPINGCGWLLYNLLSCTSWAAESQQTLPETIYVATMPPINPAQPIVEIMQQADHNFGIQLQLDTVLKELNLPQVRLHPPILTSVVMYHYLQKKHQQWVEPLTTGLRRLTASQSSVP